jgi:hypothetical protein
MELYEDAREKAKKNIQIADHMLSVTYPLIKDTKLLLAIIENIFLAMTNSMASVLYRERMYKRIPPFQNSFESKFNVFRERFVHKYNIDKSLVADMQEIKNIIVEHKKSPIEFQRKDRFVICSSTYKLRTLSLNDIKNYLERAKIFIQEMDNILNKNG